MYLLFSSVEEDVTGEIARSIVQFFKKIARCGVQFCGYVLYRIPVLIPNCFVMNC